MEGLRYNNIPVYLNPWVDRTGFVKTKEGIVMHPYMAATLMLQTTAYSYKRVFNIIGINKDSLDACFECATDQVNRTILETANRHKTE